MKLRFFLKRKCKASDLLTVATIYVRCNECHRYDEVACTRMKINPNCWDEKKMRVKNKAKCSDAIKTTVNEELTRIEAFITTEYLKYGELPSKGWLKQELLTYYGGEPVKTRENSEYDPAKNESFYSTFDRFMDSRIITKTRRQHFVCLRERLSRYEIYMRIVKKKVSYGVNIHGFNIDDFTEFKFYLENEFDFITKYPQIFEAVPISKYVKPRPMGRNSIIHVLVNLRIFLKWCYIQGLTHNHSYMSFEIPPAVYGTPYYLTLEERDRLYNYPFKSEKLSRIRDSFVFQCMVGCRISDEKRFTWDNIIDDNFLEYVPQKTSHKIGKSVRVPLIEKAKVILNRYKEENNPEGRIFRFPVQTDYEKYIKEICKEAGINRMVAILNPQTGVEELKPIYEVASTHLARRTFIGILYKNVKDPNIIASMSGHTNASRSFARYRTIDDDIKREVTDLME